MQHRNNLVHFNRFNQMRLSKKNLFLILFFRSNSTSNYYHTHTPLNDWMPFHFFSFLLFFTYRFTIKMIQIDHASLLSQHWKMCKQFDVPNSIQTDVSTRLAQIPKHSGYVNIHHFPRSGKKYCHFFGFLPVPPYICMYVYFDTQMMDSFVK